MAWSESAIASLNPTTYAPRIQFMWSYSGVVFSGYYYIVYVTGWSASDPISAYPGGTKSWTVDPVDGDTNFTWHVKLFTGGDVEVSDSEDEDGLYTIGSYPGVTSNPTPEDGGDFTYSNTKLDWDAGDGADLYDVYLGEGDLGASVISAEYLVSEDQAATEYSLSINDLTHDATYTWAAVAKGSTVGLSNEYGIFTFTVDRSPPKAVNPTPEDTASDQHVSLSELSWESGS